MTRLALLFVLFAQDADLFQLAKRVADTVAAEPQGIEALFAQSLLTEVPPKQLAALLKHLHGSQGSVTAVESIGDGKFVFAFAKGNRARVALKADQGKITAFWVGPPYAALGSLDDVVAALKKLPGSVSFQVAKLGDKAGVVAELNPDTSLAIGSAFKLYILGALIEDKKPWDEVIQIQEAYRSWPTGVLQNEKTGTPFTVEQMASKMISISDNTATDHLLAHVGRARAEAMMKTMGCAKPEKSLPFLSTLEMFNIKTNPALRTKYIAADEKTRRAMLDGEVRELPRKLPLWSTPTAIDTLEWFGSASDLVRAMDWIRRKNEPTAMKVLSINPGVDVPKERFAFAGYKGGSEPGVISMTWLLATKDGAWLAVSACWNNPEKTIDDVKFVAILQAAIYAIPK